jgi:hypothetical protein
MEDIEEHLISDFYQIFKKRRMKKKLGTWIRNIALEF